MEPLVDGVLVPLGLVLVLEAVGAVGTLVLFLRFVSPVEVLVSGRLCCRLVIGCSTYLRASGVSNFLGFFGQHSHMRKPCILAARLLALLVNSSPGLRASNEPESRVERADTSKAAAAGARSGC
jgi:hypothetical protein